MHKALTKQPFVRKMYAAYEIKRGEFCNGLFNLCFAAKLQNLILPSMLKSDKKPLND